jgi:hypothetical protein
MQKLLCKIKEFASLLPSTNIVKVRRKAIFKVMQEIKAKEQNFLFNVKALLASCHLSPDAPQTHLFK